MKSHNMASALTLLSALFLFHLAHSNEPSSWDARKEPKILVLDPVNLKSGNVDSELGSELRKTFTRMPYWKVIPRDEMTKVFRQIEKTDNLSCKGFSCAHNAGDIFHSDYTFFTTYAVVGDLYVFSMNCINNENSQVIWTKVDEVQITAIKHKKYYFLYHLNNVVRRISPQSLYNNNLIQTSGAIGVINGSHESYHANVMADRLMFHTHALQTYKVITPEEMKFTLEALDMRGRDLSSDIKNITTTGENLGVDFIIYSSLKIDKGNYDLKLSLYNIPQKSLVRTWSYKSQDFKKILRWEEVFFLNLKKDELLPQQDYFSKKNSVWKSALGSTVILAGGVMALLTFNQK